MQGAGPLPAAPPPAPQPAPVAGRQPAQARIAERNGNIVTIEVTCPCGQRTYIQCQCEGL
jgi:hypothetical protein